MMYFIYSLLSSILLVFAYPVALILSVFGHTHVMRRLIPPSGIPPNLPLSIWIHAASVGESLIAYSMAGEIKRRYPGSYIAVSTNK